MQCTIGLLNTLRIMKIALLLSTKFSAASHARKTSEAITKKPPSEGVLIADVSVRSRSF